MCDNNLIKFPIRQINRYFISYIIHQKDGPNERKDKWFDDTFELEYMGSKKIDVISEYSSLVAQISSKHNECKYSQITIRMFQKLNNY